MFEHQQRYRSVDRHGLNIDNNAPVVVASVRKTEVRNNVAGLIEQHYCLRGNSSRKLSLLAATDVKRCSDVTMME